MSERFIKFIPSQAAMFLVKHKKPAYQNAFRLLTIIAEKARRHNGYPDGLTIGQCYLGDWKEYGMSEQNYRTAKKILEQLKHIKIIETNRNLKKATTRVTTEGTLVELCSSTVYDINIPEGNDSSNDRLTTHQRLANDEQERRRIDISNDISNNALRAEAHPASPNRSKDLLTFSFQSWKFEGISEQDMSEWKAMYPHIDLQVETLKASQWLKSNPSKSNKKQWRKFLTGWFTRGNDTIENKKAYRSAAGGSSQDKRTKNMDGTPITSKAEDLF